MRTTPWLYLTSALLAGLLLLGGGTVRAEENPTGPYVTVGVGDFTAKIDDIEGVTDAINNLKDSTDTAWKIGFGWRFAKFFALETDYLDLGNPSANFDATGSDGDYKVELSGYGLYAIGTLPLGIFELFAKLGYYFHDLKVNVDFNNIGVNNGSVFTSDDNGQAWVYGIGAGVTLIDHLNFNLEYEQMDIDKLKDSYTFWLNAAWRF
jgi:opacity protein-like surface antigen